MKISHLLCVKFTYSWKRDKSFNNFEVESPHISLLQLLYSLPAPLQSHVKLWTELAVFQTWAHFSLLYHRGRRLVLLLKWANPDEDPYQSRNQVSKQPREIPVPHEKGVEATMAPFKLGHFRGCSSHRMLLEQRRN